MKLFCFIDVCCFCKNICLELSMISILENLRATFLYCLELLLIVIHV